MRALLPELFRRSDPVSILVVGGGDGLLLRELLKISPPSAEIDLVDLDGQWLELAKKDPRLTVLNDAALTDPRVTLHVADPVAFARNSKKKYELVHLDFPLPYSHDLARMSSVEFFDFLNRLLLPDGILEFVLPITDEGEGEDWEPYYGRIGNVLRESGFSRAFSAEDPELSGLFVIAGPESLEVLPFRPEEPALSSIKIEEFSTAAKEGAPDKVNSLFRPVTLNRSGGLQPF